MNVKNTIKSAVYRLPRDMVDGLYRIYNVLKYPQMREVRKSFGHLHPDKTFYVIRPRTDGVEGLMALFYNVLRQLSYARTKGYISVVDFQNYETQYRDENIAEKNVWEYYFTQPSEYSLEEVYCSKHVVLSGINGCMKSAKFLQRDLNDESLNKAHRFMKESFGFSEAVQKCVECEKEITFQEKAIGLYLRGTDYIALKPAGENVQPNPEQAFEKVEEIRQRMGLRKVFLVTEDDTLYQMAKEYFGEDLLIVSYDSFISNYSGTGFLSKDRAIDELSSSAYQRGMNYLVKLILLSQCSAIIGGHTCGSWAACVMADESVEKHLFELGIY